MKMRRHKHKVGWSLREKKAFIVHRMQAEHAPLIFGARRLGLGFKGYVYRNSYRFQITHIDLSNPRVMFYQALGINMPDEFVLRRYTVGGYERLMAYLKLHVPEHNRVATEVDEDAVEVVDEDEDG